MDMSTRQEGGSTAPAFPDSGHFSQFGAGLLKKASSVVLLRIELDRLDFVLRTYGSGACEQVQAEAGERMMSVIGSHGLPFLLNQNSFALPLPDCSYDKAVEMGRQLRSALRKPYRVAGMALRLDAQIGMSHFPTQARQLDDLLQAAAFACHMARERHSGFALYDKDLDERERERFRLMADLEQALQSRSGLMLHYQPLVDLNSGRCASVEALCRWRHPELGQLSPASFLPYVEQTSLSLPLAETVLDMALGHWVGLREGGYTGQLSVNLSPSLCAQPAAVRRLLDRCDAAQTDPSDLCFEFPEVGIIARPEAAQQAMQALRDKGARVLVDDFGAGETALAALVDLPADLIKLDRRLLERISEPRAQAVVSAISELAGKLGLATVGKGIETAEQAKICKALGIDFGQGYYLARPMSRGDLRKWLSKQDGAKR